jgi:uncharacterized protein YcfL
MNSLVRLGTICLAAVALVVCAGCGSDTKSSNDYVDSVNKAQTDLLSNVQKVGSASSGSDPTAAAKKTFSDLSSAIDKFIADLKAVDPPDKVKDLHNRLISEITQVGARVKQAGGSLDSQDPQTLVTAQSKLATSVTALQTEMSKTIDDINTKLHS